MNITEVPKNGVYLADALTFSKSLPNDSLDLVLTSPPYADIKVGSNISKEYKSIKLSEYVEWFLPIADEIKRALKPNGSFVLNIDTLTKDGDRQLYIFDLLLALVRRTGLHLIQDAFYIKPPAIPAGSVSKYTRLKPSVEYVWWFSKTKLPKANAHKVLMQYSNSFAKKIRDVSRKHLTGMRYMPSGHSLKTERICKDRGGSIPVNYVYASMNDGSQEYMEEWKKRGLDVHPARYPEMLCDFWLLFLTEPSDVVFDPFTGSGTTLSSAKRLGRRYIGCDISKMFIEATQIRLGMVREHRLDMDMKLDEFVMETPIETEVAEDDIEH